MRRERAGPSTRGCRRPLTCSQSPDLRRTGGGWSRARRELRAGHLLHQTAIENCEEELHQMRVPLLPHARAHAPQGLLALKAGSIGAIADHRIPRVGDGGDAGTEWYVLAGEVVGVTGAVHPLVVVTDDREEVGDAAEREADAFALDR